ncbi:MAG: hypothetical protein WBX25_11330, partial [Rhodomicrobium sp.]
HCRLRMVNQEVFIDGLAERPQTGERHRLSPSRASASHNESANILDTTVSTGILTLFHDLIPVKAFASRFAYCSKLRNRGGSTLRHRKIGNANFSEF